MKLDQFIEETLNEILVGIHRAKHSAGEVVVKGHAGTANKVAPGRKSLRSSST